MDKSADAERLPDGQTPPGALALEAAGMGEFQWDARADRLTLSPRAADITGLPAGAGPGDGGMALYRNAHSDDVEAVRRAVTEALTAEGRYEAEYRTLDPATDRVRWLFTAGLVVHDGQGAPTRVVGVVQDITERKATENARETLVAELDHRVKNVLASVQSLAAQSARKTTSVDAFLKNFAGRLEAMASAHTLLTATRWRGAEIGNVAAAELGGLAQGQAHWSGPELLLNPRATNALTLALHELATNAMKYGALSAEAGRVDVAWTATPGGGFELVWAERDGPPVSTPTHRGFGSTLLERVTGRELGGVARMEFKPGGLRVAITADASALASSPRRPASPEAAKPAEPAHAPQMGASAGVAPSDSVQGRRIIIVEDAVLLALELEAALTEAGAEVVGMAVNVAEALEIIERPFDVAVLDANLNGESVGPVALALAARGTPFIIATGYGDAGAPPEGADEAPVVRKPYNVHQIAQAVGEALAKANAKG